MSKKSQLLFCSVFLAGLFFLTHCASTQKSNSASSRLKSISQKGTSIYYYLVSQLENFEGSGDTSIFYLEKSIKKNPQSTHLVIQKAYQLARENKISAALKLAQKVYNKDAGNVDLNILMGKIFTTEGNSQNAIHYYKRAIQIDEKAYEAYQLLARQYLAIGERRQAIDILKKIISFNPENLQASYYLASIYAAEKEYSKALAIYEEMLEVEENDPQILNLIAEIFLAQKDYKKALQALIKIKDLYPHELRVQVRIGLLYYELKDHPNAIKTFKEILTLNPNSDKIQYYLGLLYQERGELAAALDYFEDIPPDSEFYKDALQIRVILYKKLNQLQKAFVLAKSAVDRNPQDPLYYDMLASLFVADQNYAKAIAVLRKGLQKNPNNEMILFALGVLYEKTGDWRTSIDFMRSVLVQNEKNILALNFIGYTYAEHNENLTEAKTFIERALRLKPDDGFVVDSLGWLHFQQGDYAKALELLSKADRLSPNEPTILEHLGDVHLRLRDKRRARTYFERALFELQKKSGIDAREQKIITDLKTKIGNL